MKSKNRLLKILDKAQLQMASPPWEAVAGAIMSGTYRIFAGLLFVSLMLVSCTAASYECSDPLGCLKISANGQLLIGAMLATSGEQRPLGTSSLVSVNQAITDKDNLFTHSIQLITFGTDCTGGSAQLAATEFSTYKNITAVIGPTCSDELAAAGSILLNAGIPLLGPVLDSSAAFTLTNQLLAAIQKVTVRMPDNTLYIPRQALFSALNLTR
jgi:ABC-type branched-subunit amino acid transport system substrate-binding protein